MEPKTQVGQNKGKAAEKSASTQPKHKGHEQHKATGPAHAKKVTEDSFVFGKKNYQMMVAGLIVICIGFFLMYGRDDIFSFTKITLAPIVVLLGFAIEVVAIMIRPKSTDEHP